MSNIQLKYIGKGSFLPNVPARDLTKEEVDQHGGAAYLIGTGLYENMVVEAAEEAFIAEDVGVDQPYHSKNKVKE